MPTYDKTITIRCTEEQAKTWTKKAEEFELSLNQFIRLAANTLVFTEKPILKRYVYGDSCAVTDKNRQAVANYDKEI